MAEQRPVLRQRRGVRAEQRAREAGVADMQLRRLSRPGAALAVPARQPVQRENPLEQAQVMLDGAAAQAEVGGDGAHVQHLRGLRRRDLQQAGNVADHADLRQLAHVALRQHFHVIAVPAGAALPGRQGQRGRVAAVDGAFGELRAQPLAAAIPEAVSEQALEEVRRAPLPLALRQRMQRHDVQPPG